MLDARDPLAPPKVPITEFCDATASANIFPVVPSGKEPPPPEAFGSLEKQVALFPLTRIGHIIYRVSIGT
jgi:hypothetical protein